MPITRGRRLPVPSLSLALSLPCLTLSLPTLSPSLSPYPVSLALSLPLQGESRHRARPALVSNLPRPRTATRLRPGTATTRDRSVQGPQRLACSDRSMQRLRPETMQPRPRAQFRVYGQ